MRPPFTSILAIVASLFLLAGCGTAGSQAGASSPHAHSSRDPAPTGRSSASPTPVRTPPADVTFTVTGSDGRAGVDITYGSQNANLQGGSGLPWSVSMAIQPADAYYDVQAQLEGAGSITCKVEVEGVTKTAHAAGAYDFCRAEVINDLNGRWIAE